MLADHDNPLTDITFSPNGEMVATASADRTARIWKASTGAVLSTLLVHGDTVTGVRFVGNTQVVTAAVATRRYDAGTSSSAPHPPARERACRQAVVRARIREPLSEIESRDEEGTRVLADDEDGCWSAAGLA